MKNLDLKIQNASGNCLATESEVREARNRVALEKRKDTRLFKAFFDSAKVKEAKKALSKSEELLSKRNNILEELQKKEKNLSLNIIKNNQLFVPNLITCLQKTEIILMDINYY